MTTQADTGFTYAHMDDEPKMGADAGNVQATRLLQYGGVSVYVFTFPPDSHAGEDFHGTNCEAAFVVEGEIKDEYGTYPKGTVWLARPGTVHHPWSEKGGRILGVLADQNA
ncbi:cupin domain-containing protein [Streptomyces sp. NPDC004647]|uniref:cupin domain-containing protein n=1 Tax=Streptomyces sp. NPDC004647 TaxID=3154671 RepID=UPI0033A1717F